MKQDEIIEMARQAGFEEQFTRPQDAIVRKGIALSGEFKGYKVNNAALKAFAKLVAMRTLEGTYDEMIDIVRKNEREACAKHLDNQNTAMTDILSAEIRARGEA